MVTETLLELFLVADRQHDHRVFRVYGSVTRAQFRACVLSFFSELSSFIAPLLPACNNNNGNRRDLGTIDNRCRQSSLQISPKKSYNVLGCHEYQYQMNNTHFLFSSLWHCSIRVFERFNSLSDAEWAASPQRRKSSTTTTRTMMWTLALSTRTRTCCTCAARN